jgi:NADH-quinone oxidoreductase subunit J
LDLRDGFFYGTGAVLIALALATVLARNLFRAALSLLGVLWCTAMLFLLLKAEMVALVQVMVYIGGIMIFVLYAVLLTSELGGRMPRPTGFRMAWGVLAALACFIPLLGVSRWTAGATVQVVGPGAEPPVGNIAALKAIGLRLLDPGPDGFLIPFELISLVLLAAMVGAIAIARQGGGTESPAAGPAGAARSAPEAGAAALVPAPIAASAASAAAPAAEKEPA